jgi:alkylation response protein AidB-like acyl-CoA dehydrogenase
MIIASLRSALPGNPASATDEPPASRAAFDELLADIAEAAPRHDRDGSFPFENFERLHQEGLLGLTVRGADGGGNAGLAEAADIVGAIGQACPSTALVFAMQSIHQKAIARSQRWPEHLRIRVGRSATGCGALINALRVEPSLGTPARGGLPETVARRTAEGWSISGRKIYSTGSPGLTWMQVFARTDEATPRIGMFLVRARCEGVRIEETWNHLGLRASGSHDVIFEDVALPEDHAVDLRAPGDWRQPDPIQASWNAAIIGSLYTGVARAARDWLVQFLNGRVPGNLGASLATLPRMQEAVGAIEALLVTNARLIGSIAVAHDRGEDFPPSEAGLLKNVIAENAIAAVEQAVKPAGNHALSRTNPLERHLRDVLCSRVHTPQADSAHIAAGRAALGL